MASLTLERQLRQGANGSPRDPEAELELLRSYRARLAGELEALDRQIEVLAR